MRNKHKFILFLSGKLLEAGFEVHHAKNDSDILIVQTVVAASSKKVTFVVGNDTDLEHLLPFHAKKDACNILFCPEPKQSASESHVWSVKQCQDIHGLKVCQHLLFIHAILGCDAIYEMEKGISFKSIKYEVFCKLMYLIKKKKMRNY